MTHIWYSNSFVYLKIIEYDTLYMYIENHINILKNMINISLLLSTYNNMHLICMS